MGLDRDRDNVRGKGVLEGTMIVRRIAKNFTKGLLEETVEGNSSRLILDIQIGGSCKSLFQGKTVCHFSSTDNDIVVRLSLAEASA